MNVPVSELAGLVGRCQAGIDAVLQRGASRAERAAGLAEFLREMVPQTTWTACVLHGEATNAPYLGFSPEAGDATPREHFQSQLPSLDALAPGVQVLSSPNVRILVTAMYEREHPRGYLAIALAADATPEAIASAEALLTVCAPLVALRWTLETMYSDQEEMTRFALVGQAFLGLSHELNNTLNSMMLQTSVVQLRVDAQARSDLSMIRQHGAQAAGLIRSLQHVVQERRSRSYAVDLNSAVADVLEERALPHQGMTVQFAGETPRIQSTRSAVKQLVRLLLQGVCAGEQSVQRLWTEKREAGAVLGIVLVGTDTSETVPSADMILWQYLDDVGRQAGQSLLRQLEGEILLEPAESGGIALRIIWGTNPT